MMVGDVPRYPVMPRRIAEQPAVYRWQLAPLPPTTNNAYKTLPNGGRALTFEAKQWKQNAVSTITVTSIGLKLPEEPLALHVRLYPPTRQRWDTDGRLKLLVDAFAEAFDLDDRGERIPLITARRMDPEKGVSRVELAVETFASWRQRTNEAGLWEDR